MFRAKKYGDQSDFFSKFFLSKYHLGLVFKTQPERNSQVPQGKTSNDLKSKWVLNYDTRFSIDENII